MAASPNEQLASPALRDRFLIALDACDYAALYLVGAHLAECTNPLPSTTCSALGLKLGSTYADGVRVVRREGFVAPAIAPRVSDA